MKPNNRPGIRAIAARRVRGRSNPPAMPLPLPAALFGARAGAFEVFRGRCIAIVGCGSVGGRIALLLARMGIGRLLLIDPKEFKPASLATHEMDPGDVGQSKAEVMGRRCKAINPASTVRVCVGSIESLDLFDLASVDFFVMAPDLLMAEIALAQKCLWLGRPLLHAAVHGPTLTAQTRFFSNAKDRGACPACSYGQAEWDLMSRQVRFSCDGAGSVASAAPSPDHAASTNSIGALCSLAADFALLQLLRFGLDLGQPVSDSILEHNGFTHRTILTPLRRNPDCRLDHTTFKRVTLTEPFVALSPSRLAEAVLGPSPSQDTQFEVAGHAWTEFGGCHCERPRPLRRFVPTGQSTTGRCPSCSRPVLPLAFYSHRTVAASLLGSCATQTFRSLGIRQTAGVLVRRANAGFLTTPSPDLLSPSTSSLS